MEESYLSCYISNLSGEDIYSGLLRMSDLVSMQPNINIKLYLVAPDERREKVTNEINRPTFSKLKPSLPDICQYIAYSYLFRPLLKIGLFSPGRNAGSTGPTPAECLGNRPERYRGRSWPRCKTVKNRQHFAVGTEFLPYGKVPNGSLPGQTVVGI